MPALGDVLPANLVELVHLAAANAGSALDCARRGGRALLQADGRGDARGLVDLVPPPPVAAPDDERRRDAGAEGDVESAHGARRSRQASNDEEQADGGEFLLGHHGCNAVFDTFAVGV